MGLSDKFRINELANNGSKVIRREDSSGKLLVRKKDNKQVPPSKKNKPFVPFGQKPIKGKQISPKYKSDWLDTDEFNTIPDGQESFAGETSGYLEKPKYNEEELQKSLDVKVDELIKKPKAKKLDYVLKSKYDSKQREFDNAMDLLGRETVKLNSSLSEIETLLSQIDSLEIKLDLAKLQEASAQNETQAVTAQLGTLLTDFQTSLIAGSKEGIERTSLSAQVRGLQAQKSTLKSLLESQKDLVKTLQQQAVNQAATTAALGAAQSQSQETAAQTEAISAGAISEGEAGFKVVDRTTSDFDFRFRSNTKSSGWEKNGTSLELLNLDDEKSVTWSISVKPKSGGHGLPWLGFSKTSGTLPKRVGKTAGKTVITAKKVKVISSPRGKRKVFTDEATLKIGTKTFTLTGQFYRKERRRGKGN